MFAARVSTLATIVLLLAQAALAQPALERVEEGVRRQLVAPVEGSPATAVEPGYLGVIAEPLATGEDGVRVREAVAGGPAAKAGLAAGDVIVAINGTVIREISEMGRLLEPAPAGTKVELQITRANQTKTVSVTLGARPPVGQRRFQEFGAVGQDGAVAVDPAAVPTPAPRPPRLGIRTDAVTEEERQQMNLHNGGAKITSITAGSPADKASLPLGAVIIAVDDQPVSSPTQMATIIAGAAAGQQVELTYLSNGQQIRKHVTLAGAPGAQNVPQPVGAPLGQPVPVDGDLVVPGDSDARIRTLEQRVTELEQRIKELETAAGRRSTAPK